MDWSMVTFNYVLDLHEILHGMWELEPFCVRLYSLVYTAVYHIVLKLRTERLLACDCVSSMYLLRKNALQSWMGCSITPEWISCNCLLPLQRHPSSRWQQVMLMILSLTIMLILCTACCKASHISPLKQKQVFPMKQSANLCNSQ